MEYKRNRPKGPLLSFFLCGVSIVSSAWAFHKGHRPIGISFGLAAVAFGIRTIFKYGNQLMEAELRGDDDPIIGLFGRQDRAAIQNNAAKHPNNGGLHPPCP